MSNVHLILQGKGGCGKTFAATLLAQYFAEQGVQTINIDTDPVNTSFSSYKGLDVKELHLMEDGKIKPLLIDALIQQILGCEETTFIIDNGASSFLPMNNYIISTGAVEVLEEAGHKLFMHTMLASGTSFDPTLDGFDALCKSYPSIPKIVWINEFFGDFSNKGKSFETSPIYKKYVEQIKALIKIPRFDPDLMEPVLTELLKDQMTFAEAREDSERSVMDRSRLHKIWTAIQTLMAQAQIG